MSENTPTPMSPKEEAFATALAASKVTREAVVTLKTARATETAAWKRYATASKAQAADEAKAAREAATK